MILLIKTFHLEMIFEQLCTSTINFQVRDLDLQAMGGVRMVLTKTFGPIPIIIYESDSSMGLEIMRCSIIRRPKALRTTIHVEGRAALILVYRFTYRYIAI